MDDAPAGRTITLRGGDGLISSIVVQWARDDVRAGNGPVTIVAPSEARAALVRKHLGPEDVSIRVVVDDQP